MTPTEAAQIELEQANAPLLAIPDEEEPSMQELVYKHTKFLRRMLGIDSTLPPQFASLDASHPWMAFWPVNALSLLNHSLNSKELERVAESVLACQNTSGGFGGGPGQPSHLAATYAAIMTLSHCGPTYWSRIRVDEMHEWILSLKQANGSIKVCAHGEADPRATYCALAVSTILGITTSAVRSNIGEYIKSCQTYEGGFANQPLGEAHGGYAFCSLATLVLLQQADKKMKVSKFCDVNKLAKWLTERQDEGIQGFSGRANKLVDGCYSYWVGGCWPLIEQQITGADTIELWNKRGLRNYVVKCCQDATFGGLIDKPGAKPDAYHTNYCLAGLSCAQHSYKMQQNVFNWQIVSSHIETDTEILITPINPVFGIPLANAQDMNDFFVSKKPSMFEYLGFSIYVGTYLVFIVYLLWAFLPDSWLKFMHVSYYPSRWWAITIPAFIIMFLTYLAVLINAYNMEKLTPKPTSLATFTDDDAMVHDTPLKEVNKMYRRK